MFWERICTRKQHKKITALIDISYVNQDGDTIEFNSAQDFYIDYTEQYIGLNLYVVFGWWILWFILLLFFLIKLRSKRKCVNKECNKKIKKDMKICPYCGTKQISEWDNEKKHKDILKKKGTEKKS